ncbi:MAG: efflux RND transporter periplasmic adaptor subunit [Rhodothermales bacterium]
MPRLLPLFLTAALALAACGDDAPDPVAAEAPPPPSIRVADETRLVRLDDAQAAELAVQTVRVAESAEPVVLTVPGTVEPSPEAYAVVSAPIGGRVVRIGAHEGEAVRAGQTVALIESLELASLVGDYLEARAEADFQRQQVERYEPLVEKRITARSVLDKARADLQRADALVQAAKARLSAAGVSDAALDRYARDGGRAVVAVTAPRSGFVQEHRIDLGQSVAAYDELATIVSSAEVLVRGFVSPDEAARVRPGDAVTIRPPNDPARAVAARVTSVQPATDAERRAVAVNVRVATPARELVPGQSVELDIATAATASAVLVPMAAVVYEGDAATVFVRRDDRTFERRAFTLGRVGESFVVATGGIEAGEEVAVSQVFSLKALGRYAQYGEE